MVWLRIAPVLIVALLAVGCGDPGDDIPEPPPIALPFPVDSALLAQLPPTASIEAISRGERLYRNCSVCHGLSGEGTQLGPPLADADWVHVTGEVEEIAAIIRSGVPSPVAYPIPMPPMGGDDLTDDEVNLLSIFVRARSLADE